MAGCVSCNARAFLRRHIRHEPWCAAAKQRAVDKIMAAVRDLRAEEQVHALGISGTLLGLCIRVNQKGECGCHKLAPPPAEIDMRLRG